MHAGDDGEIVIEVLAQRDAHQVRGIALTPTQNLPEVMGDRDATLGSLISEYLFVSLFTACAESLASENASRLAAMQRAEKKTLTNCWKR